MPVYAAPLDNIRFVLHEVLNAQTLSSLPNYGELSKDLIDQIIDSAAQVCQEV